MLRRFSRINIYSLLITLSILILVDKIHQRIILCSPPEIEIKNDDLFNESLILEMVRAIEKISTKIDKIQEKNLVKVDKLNENFHVNPNHGFWDGSADQVKIHHRYDENFAKGLAKFFSLENAKSLIDFGAGLGNYSGFLAKNGFFVTCVDGHPKTQEITQGLCTPADLSQPIKFSSHDWAFSIEVGEHIPPQFETNFLTNLNRVNSRGAVLSWAILNQGGDGHYNTRNNDYIIKRMEKDFNYMYDNSSAQFLRDSTVFGWLKRTIMVFRKPILNDVQFHSKYLDI